jgi:hypothetical protein
VLFEGLTMADPTYFEKFWTRPGYLVEARKRTGLLSTAHFLPPAIRNERRHRAEADELIDFLGLGRYADMYIADLSTGTRRIVELAGLLALDARLLCLDEPTAGHVISEGVPSEVRNDPGGHRQLPRHRRARHRPQRRRRRRHRDVGRAGRLTSRFSFQPAGSGG